MRIRSGGCRFRLLAKCCSRQCRQIFTSSPSEYRHSKGGILQVIRAERTQDLAARISACVVGADHLDLVPSNGYLGKMLGNARVVRYLAQHHHDILAEIQKLAETDFAAA